MLVSQYKEEDYTRIRSLNFIGGAKTVDNPIPTEFPWKTAKQPRRELFACQPPLKKVKRNDEVGENDCDESEKKRS